MWLKYVEIHPFGWRLTPFLGDLAPTIANDNKRNHQPNIIELFFDHIPHIRNFKYD